MDLEARLKKFDEHIEHFESKIIELSKIETEMTIMSMQFRPKHNKSVEVVLWDQLSKAPIGYRIIVNEYCWFEKVDSEDPNLMKFVCEMKKGAELSKQLHDFREEVEVLKGDFIDRVSGESFFEGDRAIFQIKQEHKPGSEKGAELMVYMYKDVTNLTSRG